MEEDTLEANNKDAPDDEDKDESQRKMKAKEKDNKRCSICLNSNGRKEDSFPSNRLLVCSRHECSLVVHQNCVGYNKVSTKSHALVPSSSSSSDWTCQKCLHMNRSSSSAGGSCSSTSRRRETGPDARVTFCPFCPQLEGAFGSLSWRGENKLVHKLCNTFVPKGGGSSDSLNCVLRPKTTEITLEYKKTCYICHQQEKYMASKYGAYLKCFKSECTKYFHPTCGHHLMDITFVVTTLPRLNRYEKEEEIVLFTPYCEEHSSTSSSYSSSSSHTIVAHLASSRQRQQQPQKVAQSGESQMIPKKKKSVSPSCSSSTLPANADAAASLGSGANDDVETEKGEENWVQQIKASLFTTDSVPSSCSTPFTSSSGPSSFPGRRVSDIEESAAAVVDTISRAGEEEDKDRERERGGDRVRDGDGEVHQKKTSENILLKNDDEMREKMSNNPLHLVEEWLVSEEDSCRLLVQIALQHHSRPVHKPVGHKRVCVLFSGYGVQPD